MRMLPGATGFDARPAGAAELRAFTTACHHAARVTGGVVVGAEPVGADADFHTVEIAHPGRLTAVLRHAVLPLVAFADPRRGGTTMLSFVDHPDLATALTDASDLRVLTVEQLGAALTPADLGDLGPTEHQQIAYWRPGTVGELLFNVWD